MTNQHKRYDEPRREYDDDAEPPSEHDDDDDLRRTVQKYKNDEAATKGTKAQ